VVDIISTAVRTGLLITAKNGSGLMVQLAQTVSYGNL
jgi:hypothetical protein